MSNILKHHMEDHTHDTTGSPLSHLSHCFIKCTKVPGKREMTAEERQCYSGCLDKVLTLNQAMNSHLGEYFQSYQMSMTQSASNSTKELMQLAKAPEILPPLPNLK